MTTPTARQGWRASLDALPRATRDTLFHLAVLAWASAPHALHLPLWCSALTAALLVWRARLALRGGALPGRWAVVALLVVATGMTLAAEGTLLGRQAGITMLVVLMALKTLELRARRDALVVFFLGFFLVLTNFLHSQSLLTGLWLLLAVWGLLSALALAHMPVGRPPLRRAAAVAARATAFGLPLMLLLFLLFPRVGPLWGLPQDATGRTGLSGSLRLGGVASLAEDDSVALRLRFRGAVPAPEQLYFRGPVLGNFDGREWTRTSASLPARLRPRLDAGWGGPALRYEITIEPNRHNLLPLLELTPDTAATAPQAEGWMFTLRPDAQWQPDQPMLERLQLQATAYLQHRHGPREAVPGLRDLLLLPARANPRTLAWAQALKNRPDLSQADTPTLVAAVLAHISSGGYAYTLEPGPGSPALDAIDEFWLDRKLGFCEHYASAFVVVMRALGVPARLVTGYQGGEAVPDAPGSLIVRQRNAHAWAEVWQAGSGWLRVDPTAAVAPERIQRGRGLPARPGLVAGALDRLSPGLQLQLRRLWASVDQQWALWMLNYSRGQQFALLRALGLASPGVQDLALALAGLLSAAALAGAAWAWHDSRRIDPWLRLQQRVQRALLRLGVQVQAHHGPRERAARVRQVLGPRGAALAQLLERLDLQRYGPQSLPGPQPPAPPQARWWREFRQALRGCR